jgi:hypothetical protein
MAIVHHPQRGAIGVVGVDVPPLASGVVKLPRVVTECRLPGVLTIPGNRSRMDCRKLLMY